MNEEVHILLGRSPHFQHLTLKVSAIRMMLECGDDLVAIIVGPFNHYFDIGTVPQQERRELWERLRKLGFMEGHMEPVSDRERFIDQRFLPSFWRRLFEYESKKETVIPRRVLFNPDWVIGNLTDPTGKRRVILDTGIEVFPESWGGNHA